MNDYNELIERLRDTFEKGVMPEGIDAAIEAIEAMQSRVAELESRLEISPLHNVDGIMARDATIKLQDDRIFELERRLREAEDKKTAGGGSPLKRLQTLSARVAELEAERAELEKQEPVAWLDRSTEERPGDTVWLHDDLQGMSTRGLVPLYAAPPVITQHEPVTTVEDRYNADGKSCHITDDLPAGMPLYAAPPVTAPVRLTDKNIDRALSERVPGGSEVRDWFLPHDTDRGHANILTVVRAIETAVLRANGFKVDE